VDDYGHHPTEIKATLQGAHSGWKGKRIVAIFQPHLYSRTRNFYKEFARAFLNADVLIVTDVYPAREEPIEGVSGQLIADAAIAMGHKQVFYFPEKTTLAEKVLPMVQPGDMVLTIGAGDIWKVANELVDKIKD